MQSAILTSTFSNEDDKQKQQKKNWKRGGGREETDGGDCAGRANDAMNCGPNFVGKVLGGIGERIRVEGTEGEASGGCD